MGNGFSSLTRRMTEYNLAEVVRAFNAHNTAPLMLLAVYQGDVLSCYLIAKKRAYLILEILVSDIMDEPSAVR